MNARDVHSPALKTYFAESKLIKTEGSVSAEVAETTEADQDMLSRGGSA